MKELNLQYIKRSRLKQGDIFALLIDGFYLFGRVVNDKVPMMGSYLNLIYIYNVRSKTQKTDIAALTPDKLLLPPFISFPSLWSKGYAAKVGFEPIQNSHLLDSHYFKVNDDNYVDEFGEPTQKVGHYCGDWRITSLGTIDDWISDAVGIKRVPLQEEDIWYVSGSGEKIWLEKPLSELQRYTNYREVI